MDKTRCSTTSEQDVQPCVGRFAPGPWSWRRGFSEAWLIRDSKDQAIAVLSVPKNAHLRIERAANARLITAAPDLYHALLAAQEELRLIRMKDHGTIYNPALSTQITLALHKAVPQTADRTPSETPNTDESINTNSSSISPTEGE